MALSVGDIAIVGFDTDAPDTFSFVLLVDVAAGEQVVFTDNAWNGSALATNENTATWTAPSGGLTKGTVVKVVDATTNANANLGTVTGTLGGLSASGENLFAYQGTSGSPTFLYGVHNAGPWLTTGTATNSNSYLPSSLVAGVSAVALTHVDNYSYSGTTSGTQAQLLAAIGTAANWTSADTKPVTVEHPTSFTVQSGAVTPTVTLSVSATTGTEAGTTVITVTATASAAVSGNQTVDVAVTGTGITAGDYSLSGSTLTIADGATTGSITFTVVNDTDVEGSETATLTLSNPSSGLALGSTVSQTVTIIDNDAAGTLAYSGAFNEGLAFDGSVSGKVTVTLSGGDTFTGSTGDDLLAGATPKATVSNVPAGLTAVLTRTSDTTAELTFRGSATSHANADDTANLTLTFANGAFTGGNAAAVTGATKSDLAVNFADLGSSGSVQTFTPNTGTTQDSSDASAAIALDANYMVVGDDEASVLRVYDRNGGAAVLEWSYSTALANGGELDLEAATRIGDTLYFAGSHSNSKSGNESDTREYLFAVTVAGSGAQTSLTYTGKHTGLEATLATWDSSNAHGRGANYFGFTASAAAGVVPEGVNGFSIEGMTATQDGTQLLLAFRAPQSDTSTRDKAVIVPVAVTGLIGGSSPTFGTPIELNLGGRGIRSMEKAADGNGYLVLAGPAGSASTEVTHDFRLYRVSTDLATVTELDVSLDALRDTTLGSFETIVDVRATSNGTLVQLLQDNGDTDWADRTGTTVSKDLPAADQKFQGNWVTLGADVTDSTGPTLASATPADDAVNVAISSNIVLKFNEGVKAGSGSFVIKKSSDNSTVATIAANDGTQVGIAFNTVTINPTADLANGTGYYVETTGTALRDTAGNAWAGITGTTALNFSTVSAAPSYSLLITEVNSNAGPADFFELYNYGTTAIDLTGWKWDDDSANPADASAAALSGTLAPGAKLVVAASTDAAAFRSAWGLPASAPVLAVGGPGLGGGDAVAVFDASGFVAASLNFKTTNVTATDGTVITPIVRSDSVALASGHAGLAVGGTATVSAVWDGVSTSAPAYKPATVGSLGGFAQTATPANIGSPGNVRAGASLATPYTETFGTSLGEFTTYSSDTDTTNKWYRSTSTSTAEVNAFCDTAAASDWLISKAFDLSQTSIEFLSFTTWTRFSDTAITNPEVRVKYSTDYTGTGDPALYSWTELSYTPSPDNSQTTTPSGLIDLSAITGSNVYFAFHYTSSGTGSNSSSSWRVDDVKIEGYSGAVLSVAATSASQAEGLSGNTAFTFTVTRAGNTSGATTVDYAVSGAAVDAADFGGTLPSGTVSFAAGETSKTIIIQVSGDATAETNEAFTLTLSNATGGTVIAATATGTILDDDAPATLISAIQGFGTTNAMNGSTVTIEGIVTAYMPNLKGFFVQEEAADSDGNAATSEGIFVYYNNTNPGINAASVGDVVRITGTVAEYQGQTQLTGPANLQVVTDNADTSALPAPVQITLPVADMMNWEAVEGMRVEVSSGSAGGKLVVTDNYTLGQYGTVTLTSDTLLQQFTETTTPSTSGYTNYMAATQKDQIILDDGSSTQNPSEYPGRGGNDLSASNTLRAGDSVTSVVGVVDQLTVSGSLPYETSYRIQPTVEPVFTGAARPTASDLPSSVTAAEIKVAAANVLNYFTTLGTASFNNPNGTSHTGRGATDATEFTRQKDKIVANLLGMNADVLGLMEIQNNGFADGTSALDNLVDAMNAQAGAGTYAYISGPFNDGAATVGDATTAGDDAIMNAVIYKPAKVTPVGQAAVADPTLYDAFSATYGNRVPLAQTFQAVADGERFTVVVNHFKSKGSVLDADIGDGQGANNQARMEAARDLLAWLGTQPTGSADSDVLLLGDFNAYSQEDPITHLDANGYNKVSSGLSYSFDGLWGSLDHALASDSLTSQVTGAVKWAINAEEPAVLDYNTEFKSDAQDASYYAANAYRSSDHNPILIGLNLTTAAPAPAPAPTPAPEPAPPPVVVDGATVTTTNTTTTTSTGQIVNQTMQTVAPVDTPPAGGDGLADIPLVSDASGNPLLEVSLPTGVGLQVTSISGTGLTLDTQVNTAVLSMVSAGPTPGTPPSAETQALAEAVSQSLQNTFGSTPPADLVVRSMAVTVQGSTAPTQPIQISGSTNGNEALIIDVSSLPSGTVLDLSNVRFAVIVGNTTLTGGEGRNVVVADGGRQFMVLGADDDELHAGGGDDVVGSKGGDDKLWGDEGNDKVVGGVGNDELYGGDGNDILQGGASDAGTWNFKLNAQGQLQASFVPTSTELADSTGFSATGVWTTPSGTGSLTDSRFAWVYDNYAVAKDVALLFQALGNRLPTLAEMGALADGSLTSAQLGQAAHHLWAQTSLFVFPTTEGKLTQIINKVLGSGAASPELVTAGANHLGNGGTWSDIWLALARHSTNTSKITDAQGNVSLVSNQRLGDTGWSFNSGADKLFGGAGNDVLVGGNGNDELDGGAGTDMAVWLGAIADYEVALTRSTAQGAPAGSHDALVRNKLTGETDTVRSVELFKIGHTVYSVPPGQPQPANNVFVELSSYVQPVVVGQLAGVGFNAEWFV